MRLAKIKNKYLFNSNNPEGIHTYVAYYHYPTKRYRAVGLTHLYIKDEKRFKQVSKGNIKIEKFKEFDVPSGVRNFYFDKTVMGKKIDLTDKKNVIQLEKRYIPKNQSNRIKKFATVNDTSLQKKKKSRR